MNMRHLLLAAASAMVLLAGCATPDKPVRATLYDFGPGRALAPAPAQLAGPLLLAEIDAAGSLEGGAVLYRLGYADEHQLRPYANARWSAPPPQLIRQRLREQLGRDRAVLDLNEGAALARNGGALPRVLRLELEEFSQLFDSESQSWGLVRLRATLMEVTPGGEKLLGQRTFVARSPAPTPDAPGGVRALAAAADGVSEEIGQWIAQQH
jgi:cholesterol transport system auxiliary component